MTRAERRRREARAKARTARRGKHMWWLCRHEPTRLGQVVRRPHVPISARRFRERY